MVAITSVLWLTALLLLNCFQQVESARRFDRRRDLQDVPPVNASAASWIVPLQGSKTCDPGRNCIDSLTAPPSGKPLSYLAIARGVYIYTCEGGGPNEVPAFQSQSTQLYNAAPLIPQLTEAAFHALIPKLYSFDYAELDNSTLECMGTIGTVNETAIVTLFDIATFEALLDESVLAPDDPEHNGRWAHTVSPERSWDIYRVEVTRGVPPVCGSERLAYQEEYAAEYWFFHSGGEDLWTSIDIQGDESLKNTKAFI